MHVCSATKCSGTISQPLQMGRPPFMQCCFQLWHGWMHSLHILPVMLTPLKARNMFKSCAKNFYSILSSLPLLLLPWLRVTPVPSLFALTTIISPLSSVFYFLADSPLCPQTILCYGNGATKPTYGTGTLTSIRGIKLLEVNRIGQSQDGRKCRREPDVPRSLWA